MSLVKNVLKLGSANVVLLVAQLTTVLALGLVVAAPDFAIFLIGLSVAQPFAAFATLRFDSAFPAAKSRRELIALLALAAISIVLMTVIEYVGIAFLRKYELFELQTVPGWGVPVMLMLTISLAVAQLGRYWAIRHLALRVIEKATYARALLIGFLRGSFIFCLLFWPDLFDAFSIGTGLLAAELLATLITAALLVPKVNRFQLRSPQRYAALRVALRRNWKFPVLETPSAIVDSFVVHAPIFIVTHFFGLTATANFGLAFRALAVPIGQLSLALTEVMQSQYSDYLRTSRFGEFADLFRKSSLFLLAGGIVICLLLYFWLETTVVYIVGEKMREFAQICVAISPWIAVNVLVNINSRLLPLLKRQELKLVYDAVSVFSLLLVVVTQSQIEFNLLNFVTLLTAAKIFSYTAYWLLIRLAVREAVNSGLSKTTLTNQQTLQ